MQFNKLMLLRDLSHSKMFLQVVLLKFASTTPRRQKNQQFGCRSVISPKITQLRCNSIVLLTYISNLSVGGWVLWQVDTSTKN